MSDRPRARHPRAATLRWLGAAAILLVIVVVTGLLLVTRPRRAPVIDQHTRVESAVMRIARQFNTPVGFEVAGGTRALSLPGEANVESPDARTALVDLLGADRHRYTIDDVGRALEVRPVDRTRSPLDTRLERLPPLTNASLAVALNRILRTLTDGAGPAGSRRRGLRLDGLESEIRISIDVHDVSAARALTTAVEAHGQSGWVFMPCTASRSDRLWCFSAFTFDGTIAGMTFTR